MHTVWGDDPKQEQSGLRSATQTQTAFQNLTINLSQQFRVNYLKQKNIFFQDKVMTVTRKGALKLHSNYIKILKMYLMALGTLMAHFHCS